MALPRPRRGGGEGQNLKVSTFCGRHDHGWTQHDLAVGADRVLAQPAGLEALALLAGDLALGIGLGRIVGEVAQVLDVPPDVLGLAGLDVLGHEGGRGEAGQLDLVDQLRLLERPRRRGQADAGGDDDPLQVRERLCQRQGLLLVDLLALLAVGDLDQLHLGELGLARELRLHEVDPGVLVGRRRRRGQDRELALVTDQLAHALQHLLGQAVRLRLVHEQRPDRLGDVGIVGDHAAHPGPPHA